MNTTRFSAGSTRHFWYFTTIGRLRLDLPAIAGLSAAKPSRYPSHGACLVLITAWEALVASDACPELANVRGRIAVERISTTLSLSLLSWHFHSYWPRETTDDSTCSIRDRSQAHYVHLVHSLYLKERIVTSYLPGSEIGIRKCCSVPH